MTFSLSTLTHAWYARQWDGNASRIIEAVQQHRKTHGAYPENLAAVGIASGHGLRYGRDTKGHLVLSGTTEFDFGELRTYDFETRRWSRIWL